MSRHLGRVGVVGAALVLGFAACGSGDGGAGGAGGAAGVGGAKGSAGASGAAGSAGGTGGGGKAGFGGSHAGGGSAGHAVTSGNAGVSGSTDGGACGSVPACVVSLLNLFDACTPIGTCVEKQVFTDNGLGLVDSLCFSNGIKLVQTKGDTPTMNQLYKNGTLCYTTIDVPADGGGTISVIEDPTGLTIGTLQYSPVNGHPVFGCDGQSADVDSCSPRMLVNCTLGTCQ